MKCNNFTFDHYREIIRKAKRLNFEITNFREFDVSKEKILILRHDVEFDPLKALKIAEIEFQESVKSTFFFRVNCNEYNVFSFKSMYAINKIIGMGHEIGLHSENLFVSDILGKNEEIDLIKKAKTLLETMYGIKVVSVSDHGDKRAHRSLIHPPPELLEFIKNKMFGLFENHAYEKRFFKEIKYISESNGVWREGCLCENLEKYDKIQLLIHPYLWFEKHYYLW